MKVLVLGGTGAMGKHLVNILVNENIETVVTSRNIQKPNGKVRYIKGNAQDIEFMNKVLKEKWDAIIDFMTYSTLNFKKRVDLLLHSTEQYVFLSSARVYANCCELINEKSPRLLDTCEDPKFMETDEYSLSKARQEDLLINSGKSNWTIIRPYITYSEDRLQLGVLEKEEWLYRALKGRTIVFSSDIALMKSTLTYGLDVSNGILSIIGNKGALGEVLNITTKENIKWSQVLEFYLLKLEDYLGYKPNVLFSDLNTFMGFRPQLSQYQILYDRIYDRIFDNSKFAEYINDDFVKTELGLTTCLDDFLKKPYFKNINWAMEAKRDKLTNERAPIKEIPGYKQKLKYLLYRYFI